MGAIDRRNVDLLEEKIEILLLVRELPRKPIVTNMAEVCATDADFAYSLSLFNGTSQLTQSGNKTSPGLRTSDTNVAPQLIRRMSN